MKVDNEKPSSSIANKNGKRLSSEKREREREV